MHFLLGDANLYGFTPADLGKVGIGGICILLIIVGYKLFQLFLEQWKNSTDAVNKNTTAFMNLTTVFKESSERDERWQRQVMETLQDGVSTGQDTNRRVRDIQSKI